MGKDIENSLNALIMDSDKLDELESLINKFNPLEVLGMRDYEIRHTNVLGWLTDPRGSHGLNDWFLKIFLKDIINSNQEHSNKIPLDRVHISNFDNTNIYRELKNIDLLIESQENEIVVCIENKIHAKESKYQLSKYFEWVEEHYKDYTRLYVFLTKDGDMPQKEEDVKHYMIYSHDKVLELVNKTLTIKQESITNKVYDFIHYYKLTLEKILDMDEKTKEIARNIYANHKLAIDYINNNISNQTLLKDAYDKFQEKYADKFHFYATNERWLWFLPHEIYNSTNLLTEEYGWLTDKPIGCFFLRRNEDQISLHIEIGPWKDYEYRLALINHLEKTCNIKFHKNAKVQGARFSKCFTGIKKNVDMHDEDKIFEALEKLAGQKSEFVEILNKIEDALENFDYKYGI